MKQPTYAVITPVRNEADYIDKTITSMVQQTVRPCRWVIVDDGSRDRTPQLIDDASREYSWISAVHRPDRGFRKSGGGVIEAFYDGYSAVGGASWDFLVKLDGDLSFSADYFAACFAHFERHPDLGIGGGTVCRLENGHTEVDSLGDPPFHVRGATKIYRQPCWEQISPLLRAPGWDTIDEIKANMHGWTTRTFSDIELIQHKPTGGADGSWRNWTKNGLANYVTGYHPLFMLLKCVKRSFQKPPLVASAGLWTGFCAGYLQRIPRTPDVEMIRYLRQQQLRRLRQRPSIYG